ncbi:hypothetical protein [Nostoc sp. TCL26-01]|uniref:hypothetical protein n=1 Tax=Nostoc sp. TCL26-01 TaxID=2576904 RepID=UPI0015BAB855|nr:hypothetical protein [Nostoc sp. TCL26-01]
MKCSQILQDCSIKPSQCSLQLPTALVIRRETFSLQLRIAALVDLCIVAKFKEM